MELSTSVRYLKGIGEKKAQALEKLGVSSLYDLISFFPRRYEDRSVSKPVALTEDGESVCVHVLIADEPRLSHVRRGLDLVKFRAVDESGSLNITYFNQPYVKNSLHRGDACCFYGKVEASGLRRSMTNPVCEKDGGREATGRIVPIYRSVPGLSQKNIRQAVQQALAGCAALLPELLPPEVSAGCDLVPARFAYQNIHFPEDFTALSLARRRLIFEELFVLACALGRMRGGRTKETGIKLPSGDDVGAFFSSLPFSPTGAQRRAVEQALADMRSGGVMNRLVQGDVGSGKTLVAAALIWCCAKAGYMSAFMAPTEILADQHFHTLCAMLSPLGLRVGKLTGAMSAKEKREVKAGLEAGAFDLVVGTHALFSSDVVYSRLALVVTDEQHRFGVRQRSALAGKGLRPHVLVMSATPIPRTLALMIYGDLDISVLDELPPGRRKVDTFAVDESYRQRINAFILKQAGEGRQVFVVCPMVDENEDLPVKLKSAQEHAAGLAAQFPSLRVACVHGRMKAKDKDAVMRSFAAGEIDILVATTVIEVGVDVPNASLMIIENADRFGLSQLHQLRGRVGRGGYKSYCILVSDAGGDEVKARLKIMCSTNDGFEISREDLRLRGPGDFFGSRQHGLPEMHIADLGADVELLQRAQDEAQALLLRDPELSQPQHAALSARVGRLFSENAGSFN